MDILKKDVPIKFKQDTEDIENLNDIIGKYIQVNGHYHKVLNIEPVDNNEYIIKFGAGTEGTIGGEFYPATEEEIKGLQFYVEDDGEDNSYITTESSKIEEKVDSGSLDNAIDMLGKVFDTVEDSIENKTALNTEKVKEVSNYVGTTLDVLQDLNNNGVYVPDKNKKVEAKSQTDIAVDTILSYHKDGNKDELDEDWLNQDIQLTLANTESLYNAMLNTRRPAHSVAYQALLQTLNTKSDEHLTGNQIQAGFKKLGLDFKQVIKPTVDYVEEEREENKEESKEESKSLNEDMEVQSNNKVINPQDSDYYENEYLVSVIPGAEVAPVQYDVFGNDEQQALEILCAYLEQGCPECLVGCEDVEPEETDLIYVDGTEYGATKPYYMNIQECITPKTEGNHIMKNDKTLDSVKDNFNPPGAKKEESTTLTEADDEIEYEDYGDTLLDSLQNRIDQALSVGEFNTMLQSLFGKYNTIFLTYNDIYDIENWDEPQELTVWDDNDMYTLTYTVDMTDIENPKIKITDVELDEGR